MAAGPSWIALLAFLLGGGGSDLLDYIPPDAYWNQRQVQVSVESMGRELKPAPAADVSKLIEDLNSPDAPVREQASEKLAAAGEGAVPALRDASHSPSPQIAASAKGLIARIEAANRPASVRRLMAVKTLGELKNKTAIPLLEPLLKSDKPFVADYAREAIDKIDGKPVQRHRPANLRQDVWLLPDGCRTVGQVLAPSGGSVSIRDAMKSFPQPPGSDPAVIAQELTRMLNQTVDTLGNVRLDAVNFGVSGEIGDRLGFVVGIARGLFDARAIADVLHKLQVPSHAVSGLEIFQPPGAESAIFFPSDEYAVAIGGPRGNDLPVQQVVDAFKKRHAKLKEVAEMKKLIDSAPPDQPVWAVMKVTPSYAQAPVFAAFDTVQLTSTRTPDGMDLVFVGMGNDPEKAKAAADVANAGARQAVEEIRRMEQFMPPLKIVADAMATVKCDAKGGDATLTAQVTGEGSALFLLPMMGLSAHAEVRQAPAAVAPNPPPPPPR